MIDRRRKGSERAGRPEGRGAEQQGRAAGAGGNRGTEPRGRTHTMTDGKVSEIVDRGRGNPCRRLDRAGTKGRRRAGGGLGKRRSLKRREKILLKKRQPKRGKTRTVGDGCAVAISSTGRDETTSPSRWREPPSPPPLSRDLPYSLLSPWLTISPLVVVFRHFGFEPLSPLLSFRVVRALEKDAYIATLRALHFQKQSAADALVSALLSTFHPRRRRWLTPLP